MSFWIMTEVLSLVTNERFGKRSEMLNVRDSTIIRLYDIKLYNMYYQILKRKLYRNYKNKKFNNLKYKSAYRKSDYKKREGFDCKFESY
jgi:hypothetical protein